MNSPNPDTSDSMRAWRLWSTSSMRALRRSSASRDSWANCSMSALSLCPPRETPRQIGGSVRPARRTSVAYRARGPSIPRGPCGVPRRVRRCSAQTALIAMAFDGQLNAFETFLYGHGDSPRVAVFMVSQSQAARERAGWPGFSLNINRRHIYNCQIWRVLIALCGRSKDDRNAVRQALVIQRRVSLPHALPPGAKATGGREVGGEARRAPPPVLPPDTRGAARAGGPPANLARVCGRAQQPDGVQPCLIGARTFAGICPRSLWAPSGRTKSWLNWLAGPANGPGLHRRAGSRCLRCGSACAGRGTVP